MRTLIIGLLLAAGALPVAAATVPAHETATAAPAASPLDPFDRFVAAMNKGDMKAAAADHTAAPAIIDEVPPHRWQGPGAVMAWARDFETFSKANAETDAQMTTSAPTYSVVGKTSAYYVIPGHFTYKENGKAVAEDGTFAVVTTREKAGWRIASWSWAGSTPK